MQTQRLYATLAIAPRTELHKPGCRYLNGSQRVYPPPPPPIPAQYYSKAAVTSTPSRRSSEIQSFSDCSRCWIERGERSVCEHGETPAIATLQSVLALYPQKACTLLHIVSPDPVCDFAFVCLLSSASVSRIFISVLFAASRSIIYRRISFRLKLL
ncbi:hypothetical protein BJ742DRAFT_358010 [Cladochytrium replicatum]|nr:hypothetical protein BJ742DRAFT_358010 [Cladochytrium replicatum]